MPYEVTEDIFFKNFISSKQNLSESSKKNYKKTLKKFCKANTTTLEDIITNCRNQQDKIIEKTTHTGTDNQGNQIVEKTITKFNPNNIESYIKLYLDTYNNYCKGIGNKNTTINQDLLLIRSFLKYYDITLPTYEKLEDVTSKWHLLSKEDFKFIMQDSTILHASLIKFLISTGMRLQDALSLSIRDYMEATQEYHTYTDVNDFIDNAPNDMIGSWYFNPNKTRRYNIQCQTFNDPESNNLILQNLRKIKNEYLPRLNKLNGTNLELNKDDALFASQKSNYKGHITSQSITNRFALKNKKLQEHHINMIKQEIKDGKISKEDYDKEVAKIPRFHAHACRKYFETMIARNCGNLRLCTLLEGHVSPVATDSSYIKLDFMEVKEAYMAAIPDLSLENTDVKVYTSEIRREMENKINSLQQELDEKEKQVNSIEKRLSTVDGILARLDKLEKDK
ncbi:MAG: tyrosine-type recombinase/integrase [Bacilli bacterium]|nr:tyrosine-type recombinase/integrase [Bacilli bacterium]